jgi:hypothetical protein
MASTYSVISTQSYTYIDPGGQAVNGYRVTFEILQYGEVHWVLVPRLDPTLVKAEIDKFVTNRTNIAKI